MALDGRLELVRQQIEFARQYTWSLIQDIDDDDWTREVPGCPTHVAWQVGHLAMAQYGLCLFRMRGRQEVDLKLMPSSFRKQFSKGTTPSALGKDGPSPGEIRGVLNRVHQQVLEELPAFDPAELDVPIGEPYAIYPTKLGALMFCPLHEMMHAGQIGLLRRLLGKPPIR